MSITALSLKKGYGKDSIQKRLGDIVYNDSKAEPMVSNLGRHLEYQRDSVQMLGIAENFTPDQADGTKKKIIVKTFNGAS